MGLIFVERQIEQVDYTANTLKTRALPRDNAYRALNLRLSGTCTTSASAPTDLKSLTPYRLIKRIEIVANGKKTIKSIPFWKLMIANKLDFGTPPHQTNVGIVASTAYPFVAEGLLLFCLPRARRPIDTLFDARGLETLVLDVTWGSENDLYGTPNSPVLTLTKLEISTMEYTNLPVGFKSGLFVENTIEHEITVTKDEDAEKLPVDTVYRRVLVVVTVADLLNNAAVTKLSIRSGTLVFKQKPSEDFRRVAKSLYNIETLETGVYPIDFTTDGQITECINAIGMSSFDLVMKTVKQTGTNIAYILPDTIENV